MGGGIEPAREIVGNIIQSKKARWQFTRTARPHRAYALRDRRWFSLDHSEAVEQTARRMAAKIATLEVEMPEFILKRTGKKRLFTDSSERTHSYAGRVRRVMNTRLRRLN